MTNIKILQMNLVDYKEYKLSSSIEGKMEKLVLNLKPENLMSF